MSDASRPLSVRLRGHSYIAYALTPEWPISQRLNELDKSVDCSAEFFVGKPVVLDLSEVTLSQSGVAHLIVELQTRSMRIRASKALANLDPSFPVLRAGSAAGPVKSFDTPALDRTPVAPPAQQGPASLSLDSPVRSGQSVVFRAGDVTVLCSVASGAEICGRRLHPCVWHTARSRPCRLDRQIPAPGS